MFGPRTIVPDSVKSLTDNTEDNNDFLLIIYSFAENIVDVKQLIVVESPEMNPNWKGVKIF